jgi:hypothetical protein
MPEVSIPERLYRQLEAAAEGDDVQDAMWQMVHAYQQTNDPAD